VWFDSGTTHHSVINAREEFDGIADLYLEGSDQHLVGLCRQ
jgi:isoleucyl-tRNA synthetase